MKDLADWVKLCPKQLFIFDYSVSYRMYLEIFGSLYAMADKIRYYAEAASRAPVLWFSQMLQRFVQVRDE